MPTSEEAAAAAAAEALGTEAEETQSGSEETNDEVEFPSFEVELPAELLAELEEDDVEETTDDDIAALSEQYPDAEDAVLKELAQARKRADHLEKLRVKEARKNWEEEAKKFFPLSEPFLPEINATSRRGFLRTAKNVNDMVKPMIEEKVLKPAREAIEKTKVEAATETKEEIKKAWGEAVTEDQPQHRPVSVENQERRRKRGDFSDLVRGMIFNKED
jgi:hypothetical protein